MWPTRLVTLVAVAAAACGADEAIPTDRDVDAAPAGIDAGVDAAPGPDAAEYGVRCGEAMDLCTPGTSQGCCEHPDGGVGCEPSDGLCLGTLTSCDGPEDCDNPGDVCCDFGFGPSCTEPSNCDPEQGGTTVCHGDGDCPSATPSCCDGRCAATACP